jgi:hypothetical protein
MNPPKQPKVFVSALVEHAGRVFPDQSRARKEAVFQGPLPYGRGSDRVMG